MILFHFKFDKFQNGFVGVDIFFVISGYLITKGIIQDSDAGVFCLKTFYCKRIRRLFPAYFVMITAVSIFCFIVFDKNSFEKFGHSLLWTSLFSSNFWFWTESGYFTQSAIEKPLLHTWSLSVEEQFYIIFPVFLIACKKNFVINKLKIILAATVLSLTLFIYGSKNYPDATFFLLPFRAWQLLFGAIIAIISIKSRKTFLQDSIWNYLGIALIISSVFPPSNIDSFTCSIISTLGTAMLMTKVKDSKVNKFLSVKPLVFLGLLSYSLYLWHWPIYVFFKYIYILNDSILQKYILFLISITISYFSWKYIEIPFRILSINYANFKYYFTSSALLLFACISAGLLIICNDGMAFRHPQRDEIENQSSWHWHPLGNNTKYFNLELDENLDRIDIIGSELRDPQIALWGDSFAMAFIPGLNIAANYHDSSLYALTRSSNPPLLNFNLMIDGYLNQNLNKNIFKFISDNKNLHTIILACAWSDYRNKLNSYNNPQTNHDKFSELLYITISKLLEANKKVILIPEIPTLTVDNFTTRYYYLRSKFPSFFNSDTKLTKKLNDYKLETQSFINLVQSIDSEHLHILDLTHDFTDKTSLHLLLDHEGIPLYRDSGHLSTYGSERLANNFGFIFK